MMEIELINGQTICLDIGDSILTVFCWAGRIIEIDDEKIKVYRYGDEKIVDEFDPNHISHIYKPYKEM